MDFRCKIRAVRRRIIPERQDLPADNQTVDPEDPVIAPEDISRQHFAVSHANLPSRNAAIYMLWILHL
jgi:hypothetical protein